MEETGGDGSEGEEDVVVGALWSFCYAAELFACMSWAPCAGWFSLSCGKQDMASLFQFMTWSPRKSCCKEVWSRMHQLSWVCIHQGFHRGKSMSRTEFLGIYCCTISPTFLPRRLAYQHAQSTRRRLHKGIHHISRGTDLTATPSIDTSIMQE